MLRKDLAEYGRVQIFGGSAVLNDELLPSRLGEPKSTDGGVANSLGVTSNFVQIHAGFRLGRPRPSRP